jgi:hypothetical protein
LILPRTSKIIVIKKIFLSSRDERHSVYCLVCTMDVRNGNSGLPRFTSMENATWQQWLPVCPG